MLNEGWLKATLPPDGATARCVCAWRSCLRAAARPSRVAASLQTSQLILEAPPMT